MDECIWIITIKNCDYKYYISNIIGLTVNFIFFILNLFLLYFYIQNGILIIKNTTEYLNLVL